MMEQFSGKAEDLRAAVPPSSIYTQAEVARPDIRHQGSPVTRGSKTANDVVPERSSGPYSSIWEGYRHVDEQSSANKLSAYPPGALDHFSQSRPPLMGAPPMSSIVTQVPQIRPRSNDGVVPSYFLMGGGIGDMRGWKQAAPLEPPASGSLTGRRRRRERGADQETLMTQLRRKRRNAAEKLRAGRINDQVSRLRHLVDSLGYLGEKKDKYSVLTRALVCIQDLHEEMLHKTLDADPTDNECIGTSERGMPQHPADYDPDSGINYKSIFDQSGVPMALAHTGGQFKDCNAQFASMMGLTKSAVVQQSVFSLFVGFEEKQMQKLWTAIMCTEPGFTHSFRRPISVQNQKTQASISLVLMNMGTEDGGGYVHLTVLPLDDGS